MEKSENLDKEETVKTLDTELPAEEAKEVMLDPLEELLKNASENLDRIGYVNVADIIEAFKTRDRAGRLITSIEIRQEYWSAASGEVVKSYKKIVTLTPEIRMEEAGGYTTLILHFENCRHRDMNLIWNILSAYGKDSQEVTQDSELVPVLMVSAVPLSLGGQYGMVATDPIFWCLQPSDPYFEGVNQIRILFPPEGVIFLNNPAANSAEVMEGVKKELAGERLIETEREKQEQEKELFKRDREAFLSDYLENSSRERHSFRAFHEKKQ